MISLFPDVRRIIRCSALPTLTIIREFRYEPNGICRILSFGSLLVNMLRRAAHITCGMVLSQPTALGAKSSVGSPTKTAKVTQHRLLLEGPSTFPDARGYRTLAPLCFAEGRVDLEMVAAARRVVKEGNNW